MENKVVLYDSNDKKVGETFMRRARQLVKQQRAEWVDDSQNAIRFTADIDDWEAVTIPESDTNITDDDSRLIALAEKRIMERKRFIIHSIVGIPIWFVLFFASGNITVDMAMPMFFTGICLTAYVIHAYQFAIPRITKYRSHDREERRAKVLAAEIAILKAELEAAQPPFADDMHWHAKYTSRSQA
ncbi:MAG: hypothetical protein FWC89_04620 [Defluviitaleaceae bacterium]|nr:hypothetical protein [Defluviitaleaceae bacterium]